MNEELETRGRTVLDARAELIARRAALDEEATEAAIALSTAREDLERVQGLRRLGRASESDEAEVALRVEEAEKASQGFAGAGDLVGDELRELDRDLLDIRDEVTATKDSALEAEVARALKSLEANLAGIRRGLAQILRLEPAAGWRASEALARYERAALRDVPFIHRRANGAPVVLGEPIEAIDERAAKAAAERLAPLLALHGGLEDAARGIEARAPSAGASPPSCPTAGVYVRTEDGRLVSEDSAEGVASKQRVREARAEAEEKRRREAVQQLERAGALRGRVGLVEQA